jgi:hypothetical protein
VLYGARDAGGEIELRGDLGAGLATAAREAPTAAPRASATRSMRAKFSAPFTPRPPETTMSASVRPGRSDFSRGVRESTVTPVAAAENSTVTCSTSGAAGAGSGVVALGLTVMIAAPSVTWAFTR